MVCRYVGSRARYMVWSAVPYVDIPEKHVTCHYWTGLSHRQWDFVMTHGNLAFRTSVTLTNVINRWVWVPAYPPAYVFAAPLLRLRIRAYRRYSIHYMYLRARTSSASGWYSRPYVYNECPYAIYAISAG